MLPYPVNWIASGMDQVPAADWALFPLVRASARCSSRSDLTWPSALLAHPTRHLSLLDCRRSRHSIRGRDAYRQRTSQVPIWEESSVWGPNLNRSREDWTVLVVFRKHLVVVDSMRERPLSIGLTQISASDWFHHDRLREILMEGGLLYLIEVVTRCPSWAGTKGKYSIEAVDERKFCSSLGRKVSFHCAARS